MRDLLSLTLNDMLNALVLGIAGAAVIYAPWIVEAFRCP